jgi:hypothetical protein
LELLDVIRKETVPSAEQNIKGTGGKIEDCRLYPWVFGLGLKLFSGGLAFQNKQTACQKRERAGGKARVDLGNTMVPASAITITPAIAVARFGQKWACTYSHDEKGQ